MREILLHKRAEKYLERMPKSRQSQMVAALEEVASLDEISSHPCIKQLSGNLSDWYRLRVGSYRALLQPRENGTLEILYVENIGPRGDFY